MAVRLDQSFASEARRADRIGRGWLWPFFHHHEQDTAFVPSANPAEPAAINVIANRDFSEEPQKPRLNMATEERLGAVVFS